MPLMGGGLMSSSRWPGMIGLFCGRGSLEGADGHRVGGCLNTRTGCGAGVGDRAPPCSSAGTPGTAACSTSALRSAT